MLLNYTDFDSPFVTNGNIFNNEKVEYKEDMPVMTPTLEEINRYITIALNVSGRGFGLHGIFKTDNDTLTLVLADAIKTSMDLTDFEPRDIELLRQYEKRFIGIESESTVSNYLSPGSHEILTKVTMSDGSVLLNKVLGFAFMGNVINPSMFDEILLGNKGRLNVLIHTQALVGYMLSTLAFFYNSQCRSSIIDVNADIKRFLYLLDVAASNFSKTIEELIKFNSKLTQMHGEGRSTIKYLALPNIINMLSEVMISSLSLLSKQIVNSASDRINKSQVVLMTSEEDDMDVAGGRYLNPLVDDLLDGNPILPRSAMAKSDGMGVKSILLKRLDRAGVENIDAVFSQTAHAAYKWIQQNSNEGDKIDELSSLLTVLEKYGKENALKTNIKKIVGDSLKGSNPSVKAIKALGKQSLLETGNLKSTPASAKKTAEEIMNKIKQGELTNKQDIRTNLNTSLRDSGVELDSTAYTNVRDNLFLALENRKDTSPEIERLQKRGGMFKDSAAKIQSDISTLGEALNSVESELVKTNSLMVTLQNTYRSIKPLKIMVIKDDMALSNIEESNANKVKLLSALSVFKHLDDSYKVKIKSADGFLLDKLRHEILDRINLYLANAIAYYTELEVRKRSLKLNIERERLKASEMETFAEELNTPELGLSPYLQEPVLESLRESVVPEEEPRVPSVLDKDGLDIPRASKAEIQKAMSINKLAKGILGGIDSETLRTLVESEEDPATIVNQLISEANLEDLESAAEDAVIEMESDIKSDIVESVKESPKSLGRLAKLLAEKLREKLDAIEKGKLDIVRSRELKTALEANPELKADVTLTENLRSEVDSLQEKIREADNKIATLTAEAEEVRATAGISGSESIEDLENKSRLLSQLTKLREQIRSKQAKIRAAEERVKALNIKRTELLNEIPLAERAAASLAVGGDEEKEFDTKSVLDKITEAKERLAEENDKIEEKERDKKSVEDDIAELRTRLNQTGNWLGFKDTKANLIKLEDAIADKKKSWKRLSDEISRLNLERDKLKTELEGIGLTTEVNITTLKNDLKESKASESKAQAELSLLESQLLCAQNVYNRASLKYVTLKNRIDRLIKPEIKVVEEALNARAKGIRDSKIPDPEKSLKLIETQTKVVAQSYIKNAEALKSTVLSIKREVEMVSNSIMSDFKACKIVEVPVMWTSKFDSLALITDQNIDFLHIYMGQIETAKAKADSGIIIEVSREEDLKAKKAEEEELTKAQAKTFDSIANSIKDIENSFRSLSMSTTLTAKTLGELDGMISSLSSIVIPSDSLDKRQIAQLTDMKFNLLTNLRAERTRSDITLNNKAKEEEEEKLIKSKQVELGHLNNEHESIKKGIEGLKSTFSNLKTEKDVVSALASLNALSDRLDKTKVSVVALQLPYDLYNKALADMSHTNAVLTRGRDALFKRMQTLRMDKETEDKLRKDISEKDNELNSARSRTIDLEGELKAKEEALIKLRTDSEGMNIRLTEAADLLKEKDSRIEALEGEVQRIQLDLEEFTKTVDVKREELVTNLRNLERKSLADSEDIRKRDDKISELLESDKNLRALTESLRSDVDNARREAEDFVSRIREEKDKEIARLTQRLTEMSEEKEGKDESKELLIAQMKITGDELDSKVKEIDSLREEINRLRTEGQKLSVTSKTAVARVSTLETKLGEAVRTNKQLFEDASKSRTELNRAIKAIKDRDAAIKKLSAQVSALKIAKKRRLTELIPEELSAEPGSEGLSSSVIRPPEPETESKKKRVKSTASKTPPKE